MEAHILSSCALIGPEFVVRDLPVMWHPILSQCSSRSYFVHIVDSLQLTSFLSSVSSYVVHGTNFPPLSFQAPAQLFFLPNVVRVPG